MSIVWTMMGVYFSLSIVVAVILWMMAEYETSGIIRFRFLDMLETIMMIVCMAIGWPFALVALMCWHYAEKKVDK